jgi:hypothetical protein
MYINRPKLLQPGGDSTYYSYPAGFDLISKCRPLGHARAATDLVGFRKSNLSYSSIYLDGPVSKPPLNVTPERPNEKNSGN